ncbi:MAG: hypothetical protein E5Y34_19650, partial [Mesorhizobium sp.]
NPTRAICAATLLFAIGAVGLTSISPFAYVSSAQAQEEYLPTQKDFVGKWKLNGGAIRPPRDMKDAPTP